MNEVSEIAIKVEHDAGESNVVSQSNNVFDPTVKDEEDVGEPALAAPTFNVPNVIIKDEEDHEAGFAVPQAHHSGWKDLIQVDPVSLKDLEERLLYSRVTLTFGWSAEVKRLCVLGVEW